MKKPITKKDDYINHQSPHQEEDNEMTWRLIHPANEEKRKITVEIGMSRDVKAIFEKLKEDFKKSKEKR
jgi:hypothetical protein